MMERAGSPERRHRRLRASGTSVRHPELAGTLPQRMPGDIGLRAGGDVEEHCADAEKLRIH